MARRRGAGFLSAESDVLERIASALERLADVEEREEARRATRCFISLMERQESEPDDQQPLRVVR